MTNLGLTKCVVLGVALAGCAGSPPAASPPVSATTASAPVSAASEEKAVMAATTRFYAALNEMFTGDVKSMTDVWSHKNDVTYMGPVGASQVGWERVRKEWESQAAMKLGGKVEASDMHLVAGTDLAVVSNYEKGENTNAKGETQKVSIRATNVFRKEDGHWKMVGHHVDLLPQMAK